MDRYRYTHDPEHRKRPDWAENRTQKGWSRGRLKRKKRVEEKPKESEPAGQAGQTPRPLEFIRSLDEASRNVRDFITRDIADYKKAVRLAEKRGGDRRASNPEIDEMIVGFADKKKPKVAHQLSALLGYRFNLPPDFRMKGKPIPRRDEWLLAELDEYSRFEQEILRNAGIVNADDTVTLFRNTDDEQIELVELGKNSPYRGSNIESWTTRPNLDWKPRGRITMKVTARVPLKYCIASCIGRDRPFMKKEECEVMVCGAFVKEVVYVGHGSIEIPLIERNYLDEVRENIRRRVEGQKRKTPERTAHAAALFAARWLLRAARELLEIPRISPVHLIYGQSPSQAEELNMKKKNEKPITERISPLYLKFLKKTNNAFKAFELMKKYDEEHGIKPPPLKPMNVEGLLELDKEEAKRKWEAAGIPWDEEEYYREDPPEVEAAKEAELRRIGESRRAAWAKAKAAGIEWDVFWKQYKKEHPEEKKYF